MASAPRRPWDHPVRPHARLLLCILADVAPPVPDNLELLRLSGIAASDLAPALSDLVRARCLVLEHGHYVLQTEHDLWQARLAGPHQDLAACPRFLADPALVRAWPELIESWEPAFGPRAWILRHVRCAHAHAIANPEHRDLPRWLTAWLAREAKSSAPGALMAIQPEPRPVKPAVALPCRLRPGWIHTSETLARNCCLRAPFPADVGSLLRKWQPLYPAILRPCADPPPPATT